MPALLTLLEATLNYLAAVFPAADSLLGGSQADYLVGGGGDDGLKGGAGTDTFDGGDGYNTDLLSTQPTAAINC